MPPESFFTTLFLAVDPLLPIRIMAIIALVAVIWTFIHVLLHLRKIEQIVFKDNLVPRERGPRNNMVLIVCAIPVIVVSLLVFLVAKT
jgi:DMSO/TMAO reductase YedYZ heme-binding membrane subunit